MGELTNKESILHFIKWHTVAYGAPADLQDMRIAVPELRQDEQIQEVLDELKEENVIEYWTGSHTEGWIEKAI